MNIYGWKQVTKEITLESILDKEEVQFAPDSIDLELDVESLFKDPKKFLGTEISVKFITTDISRKDYWGELFVEKGRNLIALSMLYMAIHHHGTDYSFVEDVLMGDDGYVYAKELPSEIKEKYKEWARKLERKIDSLIISGEDNNIWKKVDEFAKMKITANVHEVVYIGPTIEINYSEDMTISQFSEVVKEKCHIIPVFTKPRSLDVYPQSMTLKSLGIVGNKTFSVPVKLYVCSFINRFREENNLKALLFFRYEQRPWAYILPEICFEDVQKVPNVFACIYNKLLLRLLLALGAYK